MPKILNQGFRGEAPRLQAHLLESTRSQLARNCNLLSGGLRSWKGLLATQKINQATIPKTVYLYGAEQAPASQYWLEWDGDVDVVRSMNPGDTDEITCFTGTDVPRIFDNNLVASGSGSYPQASYKLAVPAPASAPTATLGSGGSGSSRLVNYVYTYLRRWPSGKDDEGPPSLPSNSVDGLDGQEVTVGSMVDAPAGHGITHARVYRVNTGTAGADYQFVAEVAVGTASYLDTKLDTELAEVLPSEDWDPPPDDMRGLVALSNGSMAGFSGNQICLSVPYQPHAWPTSYRHATQKPIVGLGAIESTVVAATTGRSAVVYGSDPATTTKRDAPVAHGCLSKRGIVSTPTAVMYPSHEGIVAVDALGRPTLYTNALMTKQDWEKFDPSTLHAVVHNGRYFGFYETAVDNGVQLGGGFVLDVSEKGAEFTRLNFFAHASHVDTVSDSLYLVKTDTLGTFIMQWEGKESRLTYTWRSKRFLSERLANMGAARIDGEFKDAMRPEDRAAYEAAIQQAIADNQALLLSGLDIGASMNEYEINHIEINGDLLTNVAAEYNRAVGVVFRLFVDGEEVFVTTVNDAEPFRLPDGYLGNSFEFEVAGDIDIRSVAVASSITELM